MQRRDLDLDRELRAAGIGNLVAGLGAGIPGYHSLSGTVLAARLGATNAIVGVTVAACCAAAAAFGPQILSLVPTPLLGGVLMWIGGGLIHQWLISARARLARSEYAVVVLIFAIIAFVGFAWGILVGLIAAAVLFAVEYGRIDIVRYTLTGRDYQTGADASDERLEVLRSQRRRDPAAPPAGLPVLRHRRAAAQAHPGAPGRHRRGGHPLSGHRLRPRQRPRFLRRAVLHPPVAGGRARPASSWC